MNHCVPDFEIHMDDEEYPIHMLSAPKKPSMADDEIMELLWQNGQVVMQSQNHRPFRKPPPQPRNSDDLIPAGPATAREIRPEVENYNQHLFMQEDEMSSWLHYPIDDDDPPLDHSFCADFLYPPPTVNNNNNNNSAMQNPARASQLTELRQPPRSVAPRPPIPPPRRPEQVPAKMPNFAYFSKHNARAEPGPSSSSKTVARESTVVDSCDTPVATAAGGSRVSETVRSSAEHTEGDAGRGSMRAAGVAATSTGGGRGTMTCDMTMTSSPGGSSSSGEPGRRLAADDRKRKGREVEEWECQSEVSELTQ